MDNRIKRGLSLMGIVGACLLSVSGLAADKEIVVLTTFSKEPLTALTEEFALLHPEAVVRFIHRRSQSSIQLLNKSHMKDIDLVLSSSPFLMQHLLQSQRLAPVLYQEKLPNWFEPYVLSPQARVMTIGYSGAGLIWNRDYLQTHHLQVPKAFTDLVQPQYFGHLTMSSPSRSGTTQMMVESILSRYGWQEGWRILLNIGANLATISSRSFGVSDYIAKGQFGIGPTIDSYALLTQRKFEHVGFSYEADFTLMPTYIAKLQRPQDDPLVNEFMTMLLSDKMQQTLGQNSFAKFSLHDTSLSDGQLPHLRVDQVVLRETLTNKLFDLAITKRLPQLKDTWLSIIQLQQRFAGHADMLDRIEVIRIKAFDIGIAESEVLDISRKLREETQRNEEGDAHVQAFLAEFSHEASRRLAQKLAEADEQLKVLKREGSK
ncbi:ABC transporter substrate-binding protein [Vibrio sp. S234-5]|nr:ABC transporter substrate-binding protein [Vibrio sp. S234-5]